nr:unnamed protein product [Callosobruchus analis]
MDKQFSNKKTGYWGAVNTNNSTSSCAAGIPQRLWSQATVGELYGKSITTNLYDTTSDQRTMSGYTAPCVYENLGMSYEAGSSAKLSESSMGGGALNMPYGSSMRSYRSSKVYARPTHSSESNLIGDSSDEDEWMQKKLARMGHRRLSKEQVEFSDSPERYVDNISSGKLQFENDNSRLSWMEADSSYNREQWKHDYESADTNPLWKRRDRTVWHQKDDGRNPFELEESRVSWNKYRPSYDEGLYTRMEGRRSWKERDTSFDKRARHDPDNIRDQEARGRSWNQQAIEHRIKPPLKRENIEEDSVPLWKRRTLQEKNSSQWKGQASEKERLVPFGRQGIEEDTMPPWKKRVMERRMLKERAVEEVRMKKRGMDEMILQQKRPRQDIVSSGMTDNEASLSPWKRRIVEERAQLWNKERNGERVPSWKTQHSGERIPSWKRQDGETLRFGSLEDVRSRDVTIPNKPKLGDRPKKQKRKALKKRLLKKNSKHAKKIKLVKGTGTEELECEVKDSLQKANPYLKVHEWELMKKVHFNVRVEYTYLIDYNSFEALKAIQLRPYYKDTRVLVKIIQSTFKQQTVEDSTEAVDNGKKGDRETSLINERDFKKSNGDKHELTDYEISEAEILLRRIEQGE